MSRHWHRATAGTKAGWTRRARRLLPALLVLVFGVLSSSAAQAAVAPMCSEDGRSIIAPPIMAPNRGLVLEVPRPCPQPVSVLERSMPRDPGGQPIPLREGPIRAVPLVPGDLPRPYLGRRATDQAASSTGLELCSSIERPPRA